MKKKILAVLSILLIAAMAITGTVAYLTDEASDVNVMTVGNVKIQQLEYERDAAGNLQEFTQGKPIIPAVYEGKYLPWADGLYNWGSIDGVPSEAGNQLFVNGANAVDKFVFVRNVGNTKAYYRTIIALECPVGLNPDLLHVNINGNARFTWSEIGYTEIRGVQYFLMEALYNETLAPEETSRPSLMQVYLDKAATNEDVALFGETLEILVASQAVQADGFSGPNAALDTAFYDVTTVVHPWSQGVILPHYVTNYDEASGAFAEGGEINLLNDVSGDGYTLDEGKNAELKLGGNTLDGAIVNKGNITVNGGSLSNDSYVFENQGDATLNDVVVNGGDQYNYATVTKGGSTVYNNVEINAAGGGVGANVGAYVEFNSGSVSIDSAATSGRYVFYADGDGTTIVINGGEFSISKDAAMKRAYIYASAGTTVYVNGGTFGKPSTRTDYKAGIMGAGTVIITGGTFGFDPSNWVADGYTAVYANGVWTVSAN